MPTGASEAFTELTAAATGLAAAAWPVVTVVMVGLVGISLFKKFVSRAA